jgi:hypothetical protein
MLLLSGMLHPFLQNLDYAEKVSVTNTLAYYEHLKIASVKRFIILEPEQTTLYPIHTLGYRLYLQKFDSAEKAPQRQTV